MDLTRRHFGQGLGGSLLAYSLLETLVAADAWGEKLKPNAAAWLARVNQLSQSTKEGVLTQQQWQTQVEAFLEEVDLPDLLKLLDFEKLTAGLKYREQGERALRPRLPQVEGLPNLLVFGHQIFALKKGCSVPPHGHNNMATLFLVLQGQFHGRHFDRLEESESHWIVKPTIDRTFDPGEHSTVTDYKDNVHWFTATTDTAFLFNIHVLQADPKRKLGGRVYIDPLGEKLEDGRIRAPKMEPLECIRKFG